MHIKGTPASLQYSPEAKRNINLKSLHAKPLSEGNYRLVAVGAVFVVLTS